MIIDSHCHLNYSEKEHPLIEVLSNAKDNNIGLMLNIATKSNEYDKLIETSNLYKEVYFTLGVHPHEANDLNDKVIEKIYINKNNKKFVGIGETGLDFYYNNSDKNSQITSFEKQSEAYIFWWTFNLVASFTTIVFMFTQSWLISDDLILGRIKNNDWNVSLYSFFNEVIISAILALLSQAVNQFESTTGITWPFSDEG